MADRRREQRLHGELRATNVSESALYYRTSRRNFAVATW